MENRKFNISFISKEGNKASLSINSSWLIYTANAADFKKAIKEYFMKDEDTYKINDYISFIRVSLEKMNDIENGNNKNISAKIKALDSFSEKKTHKKTDFVKAAEMILKVKNPAFDCALLDKEDGSLIVTNSYVAIAYDTSKDAIEYNGKIETITENQRKTFNTIFSYNQNEYKKVSFPSANELKAAFPKKKNIKVYFVAENHAVYDVKTIYPAFLATEKDRKRQIFIKDNSYSIAHITGEKTSAVFMPCKVNNMESLAENNNNVFVTYDNELQQTIGIIPWNKQEKQTEIKEDLETDNNSAAIIPGKEETTKTENNNNVVMEYIKKHVVIPVTLETIEKDENYKQMVHILSDTDTITGFINVYRYNYNNLYNNPDIEKQNNAYMYAAETFMKEYPHMHITVSEQMKDMIVSDRELIAYGMTLKMFSFDLDKYGYDLNNPIIKIQGIELYKSDIEKAINNKRYLIKGHCVYMIMRTKTGYKTHRIYKSNDSVPLLKKNCYSLWDRESTERLINRAIIPYPA